MNINIKTTQFELTDSIRDYFEKKMEEVEKLTLSETENIILSAELGKTTNHHKSGDIFRAEINLRLEGKMLRAVSEKEDLYSAIDDVREEMVRQIKQSKEKNRSLFRKGGTQIKNIIKGFFAK